MNITYCKIGKMGHLILPSAIILSIILVAGCHKKDNNEKGAISLLKVSNENPRYFADKTGKVVYLTGAHTWTNLVDAGKGYPPPKFDYESYLFWLKDHNHNFIRLWTWEMLTWHSGRYNPDNVITLYPHPYARTGPGKATDSLPKFDLSKYDPEYFSRLRSRVESAGKLGIYVSIMLFEGWSMQFSTDGWSNHYFNPLNNINGIDGDTNKDGKGLDIYTLADTTITGLQERYVKHVIDVVNDLDNVLYEISNENHPPSTGWQYHMIRFIKDYEKQKPKQHPVGMTFQYRGGSNDTLYASPADWISPNNFVDGVAVNENPPAADGRKVILYDTDHLGGIWGTQSWVWKTLCRGMNPLFMDTYDETFIPDPPDKDWEPVRKSLGFTKSYADRMDLRLSVPANDLSSTGYCIANPGKEYLIYQEKSDSAFTVNLIKGKYRFEWFNPTDGTAALSGKFRAEKGLKEFKAPFSGDAVLFIQK
jgi:hypothetical protein